MEKNMVVVYENGIGVPFLLKPYGNQVMLLSPGLELSRLRVEALNWDNDDRDFPNTYESRFNYLCMTGEEISQNRMFALLMLTQICGDVSSAKDVIETLRMWGISCTYFPVVEEISVSKQARLGSMCYKYYGDGFSDEGCSNVECLADVIGHSLINILRTDVIPEINIIIRNYNLSDEDFEQLKTQLMDVVGSCGRIYVTFKNKED